MSRHPAGQVFFFFYEDVQTDCNYYIVIYQRYVYFLNQCEHFHMTDLCVLVLNGLVVLTNEALTLYKKNN